MAYTSRSWSSGEVVEAADANRWEQGIAGAHDGVDGALTDAKGYTDQEVGTRAPTVHDHPATDITDSSALGRTLMAVADAGAGRGALGITVDTSVGTRVMVGGVMVHGDTGPRNIESLLEPDSLTAVGVTAPQFTIQRVNNVIYVSMRLRPHTTRIATNAAIRIVESLPQGFQQTPAIYGTFGTLTQSAGGVVSITNAVGAANLTAAPTKEWVDANLSILFSYTTDQSWPTGLPGTLA